jgi:hypothetical protein
VRLLNGRKTGEKPAFGGIEPPLLSPGYRCSSAQPYSTHTEQKKAVRNMYQGKFFHITSVGM